MNLYQVHFRSFKYKGPRFSLDCYIYTRGHWPLRRIRSWLPMKGNFLHVSRIENLCNVEFRPSCHIVRVVQLDYASPLPSVLFLLKFTFYFPASYIFNYLSTIPLTEIIWLSNAPKCTPSITFKGCDDGQNKKTTLIWRASVRLWLKGTCAA